MTAPAKDDLRSVLLHTLSDRMAVVRRALGLVGRGGPDSTRSFLRDAALRAARDIADCELILRGGGQDAQLGVPELVTRALRLAEPYLRRSHTQILLETARMVVEARANPGQLIAALLLAIRDGCEAESGEPDNAIRISIGLDKQSRRPWIWLSQERRGAARGPIYPLSQEAKEQLQLAKVDVDVLDLAPIGIPAVRALRLMLPAAATPVAVIEPAPSVAPTVAAGDGRAEEILARARTLASDALEAFFAEDAAPRRVLVVDDEEELLSLFAALLPTIGVEFELARSPQQALELIRPHRFSLVITDKNMPGMSGLELLAQLKGVEPVLGGIVVTGYTSAAAISEALSLGVYDYVDKPFPDIGVLLSRIESALQRHALHARVTRLTQKLSQLANLVSGDGPHLSDPRVRRLRALLDPAQQADGVQLACLCKDEVAAVVHQAAGAAKVWRAGSYAALAEALGKARPDLVVVDPVLCERPLAEVTALGRGGDTPATHFFVATGEDSTPLACEALAAGVADYMLVSEASALAFAGRLERAIERVSLLRRDRRILMDFLTIDIEKLAAARAATPDRHDLEAFEPTFGDTEVR